jgi:hypothetical protein
MAAIAAIVEFGLLIFATVAVPLIVASIAVAPRLMRCLFALALHKAGHTDIAKAVIGEGTR